MKYFKVTLTDPCLFVDTSLLLTWKEEEWIDFVIGVEGSRYFYVYVSDGTRVSKLRRFDSEVKIDEVRKKDGFILPKGRILQRGKRPNGFNYTVESERRGDESLADNIEESKNIATKVHDSKEMKVEQSSKEVQIEERIYSGSERSFLVESRKILKKREPKIEEHLFLSPQDSPQHPKINLELNILKFMKNYELLLQKNIEDELFVKHNYKKAEVLCKELLSLKESFYGSRHHPSLGETMADLCVAYCCQDNILDQIEYHLTMLEIIETESRSMQDLYIISLNLGNLYGQRGDVQKQKKYNDKVYEILRKSDELIIGIVDGLWVTASNNLGVVGFNSVKILQQNRYLRVNYFAYLCGMNGNHKILKEYSDYLLHRYEQIKKPNPEEMTKKLLAFGRVWELIGNLEIKLELFKRAEEKIQSYDVPKNDLTYLFCEFGDTFAEYKKQDNLRESDTREDNCDGLELQKRNSMEACSFINHPSNDEEDYLHNALELEIPVLPDWSDDQNQMSIDQPVSPFTFNDLH